MKKKLMWIAVALVVIVAVGLVVFFSRLNSIVRATVEKEATKSLQLTTQLQEADVSILGQRVSLRGLNIASPEGFSAPQMFSMDDITVQVAYKELTGTPVGIAAISINKPMLVLEQAGGKFNLQSLMNLGSDEPEPADSETLKLIIGSLNIDGATVIVRPGIPGIAEEYKVTIPDIHLNQIGTADGNQNGAAIKEVLMQVSTVMAKKAADSNALPAEVRAVLSGNIEEVAKQVVTKYAGQLAKDLTKDLPAGAAEALQGILSDPNKGLEGAIGGLLKREPAAEGQEGQKEEVGKKIEEGLGNLLNRDRKKDEPATE